MSSEIRADKSPLNVVKWLVAVAIFAAAVTANYMYADAPLLYRILGVVALVLVSVGVAATTSQGQAFLVMLKEANIERRKVVWPNRQETTQTTLIVLAVVVLMAILLWAMDSLFGWLISFLIG